MLGGILVFADCPKGDELSWLTLNAHHVPDWTPVNSTQSPDSRTLGAPKESDKEVTGAGGCRSHSLDCVWEQPNGPSLNLGWPGVGESSWKRCCLGHLLLDRLMAAGCREGGAEGNFRWKGQHHRKHTLESVGRLYLN